MEANIYIYINSYYFKENIISNKYLFSVYLKDIIISVKNIFFQTIFAIYSVITVFIVLKYVNNDIVKKVAITAIIHRIVRLSY